MRDIRRSLGSTLTTLFLKSPWGWVTNIALVVIVAVLSVLDRNINVVLAALVWVVLLTVLFMVASVVTSGSTTTSGNGPYDWSIWAVCPGSLLVFSVVGLLFVGGFWDSLEVNKNDGFLVIRGPFGDRAVDTAYFNIHLPILEKWERWEFEQPVTLQLRTHSDEGFSGKFVAHLELSHDTQAVLELAQKSSYASYQERLQEYVAVAYSAVNAGLSSEDAPDIVQVGRRLNSPGDDEMSGWLHTTWTGKVEMTREYSLLGLLPGP